jgi:hypothetical protein
MTSPFFRSQPPPMPAVGEFAPVRTAIGFGGSGAGAGGFPGLSSRATVDVYPHSSWLATPAAGIQHILYIFLISVARLQALLENLRYSYHFALYWFKTETGPF